VDLTLATASGAELAMGGAIDAIGAVSEPDHYAQSALVSPEGPEALWHNRRLLLQSAMASVGFCQHPNEWWHFSWGDQLWAWRGGHQQACYGRVDT
jgi:D-alanyl-D-alanine dipeptidase